MDKIYCGTGKEKFEGNLVEISLCLSELPKDRIFEYDGKKYIKLKVVKKKEVDKYGKSHYVEVDMFEPKKEEPKREEPKQEKGWQKAEEVDEVPEDDLPF